MNGSTIYWPTVMNKNTVLYFHSLWVTMGVLRVEPQLKHTNTMIWIIKFVIALQDCMIEAPYQSSQCIIDQLEAMYFAEISVLPTMLFSLKINDKTRKTVICSTVDLHFQKCRWHLTISVKRSGSMELLESNVAVILWICRRIKIPILRCIKNCQSWNYYDSVYFKALCIIGTSSFWCTLLEE